jgi:hypothetical protein
MMNGETKTLARFEGVPSMPSGRLAPAGDTL